MTAAFGRPLTGQFAEGTLAPISVAILGAGAMGSLFGARLTMAGIALDLIDIDDRLIAVINERGLRLVTDAEDRAVRARAGRADVFSGSRDLIIVFTKTMHTSAALAAAQHLIGPDTVVLTLQNGIGNGERVSAQVPPERVLIGMTNWPADVQAPACVSSHGSGEVRVWSLSGCDRAMVERVSALLSFAGLNSQPDPDVLISIWEKAAFNAAMNSISALTSFTVGHMADSVDVRALVSSVIGEAVQTACAAGILACQDHVTAAVEDAFANQRSHLPSMLQDVRAGRPTEIDAINGQIVEVARAHGVQTPVIETLARLVRAIQSRAMAPITD